MKYAWTPVTMFLWFLTTYYGLYFTVIGMAFVFSLNWLWLIMGYLFLIGVIFGITTAIPGLLRLLILKFYGINWFSCIVHSLAGVIGVVQVIHFFGGNRPELIIGNKSVFILTGMWQIAPVKTLFLAFPFIGLVMSLLWSTIILPIYLKLSYAELTRAVSRRNRHGTIGTESAELPNDPARSENSNVNANRRIFERQEIHQTITPKKKEQLASMVRESKCPGCGKAWRLNAFLYSISPFKCPTCGTEYKLTKQ